jgi:protein TonB
LAGHFCVAFVLVALGASPSTPNVQRARPVEVRVIDTPPPTVDPAKASQAEGNSVGEKAQRARKRFTQRITIILDKPQSSAETSPSAASTPQDAAPTTEAAAQAPPILTDGNLGAPGHTANAAPNAGSGKSNSPAASSGGHASDWSTGSPQWENLRAAIQRRVVYPDVARRMDWQGKVTVGFVLLENGQVRDVRVLSSSGYTSLDSSALQAVERAAPLPPAGKSVQVVMPVVFALR